MMRHARVRPGDQDRDRGSRRAGIDAPARRARRVHPVQRKDEQRRGDQVPELDDAVDHDVCAPGPAGFVSRLNILSIRSVIRNPLTMFVSEATTAMAPRRRKRSGKLPPAMRMAPTIAMAEMALVSDISGVCSSRETRRITPRPMNVASTNTYKV